MLVAISAAPAPQFLVQGDRRYRFRGAGETRQMNPSCKGTSSETCKESEDSLPPKCLKNQILRTTQKGPGEDPVKPGPPSGFRRRR